MASDETQGPPYYLKKSRILNTDLVHIPSKKQKKKLNIARAKQSVKSNTITGLVMEVEATLWKSA